MKLRSTLYGHETPADLEVIRHLEERFPGKTVVHFDAVRQPSEEQSGIWHFRMNGEHITGFVRVNAIHEVLMYGPGRYEVLHEPK